MWLFAWHIVTEESLPKHEVVVVVVVFVVILESKKTFIWFHFLMGNVNINN